MRSNNKKYPWERGYVNCEELGQRIFNTTKFHAFSPTLVVPLYDIQPHGRSNNDRQAIGLQELQRHWLVIGCTIEASARRHITAVKDRKVLSC